MLAPHPDRIKMKHSATAQGVFYGTYCSEPNVASSRQKAAESISGCFFYGT